MLPSLYCLLMLISSMGFILSVGLYLTVYWGQSGSKEGRLALASVGALFVSSTVFFVGYSVLGLSGWSMQYGLVLLMTFYTALLASKLYSLLWPGSVGPNGNIDYIMCLILSLYPTGYAGFCMSLLMTNISSHMILIFVIPSALYFTYSCVRVFMPLLSLSSSGWNPKFGDLLLFLLASALFMAGAICLYLYTGTNVVLALMFLGVAAFSALLIKVSVALQAKVEDSFKSGPAIGIFLGVVTAFRKFAWAALLLSMFMLFFTLPALVLAL